MSAAILSPSINIHLQPPRYQVNGQQRPSSNPSSSITVAVIDAAMEHDTVGVSIEGAEQFIHVGAAVSVVVAHELSNQRLLLIFLYKLRAALVVYRSIASFIIAQQIEVYPAFG